MSLPFILLLDQRMYYTSPQPRPHGPPFQSTSLSSFSLTTYDSPRRTGPHTSDLFLSCVISGVCVTTSAPPTLRLALEDKWREEETVCKAIILFNIKDGSHLTLGSSLGRAWEIWSTLVSVHEKILYNSIHFGASHVTRGSSATFGVPCHRSPPSPTPVTNHFPRLNGQKWYIFWRLRRSDLFKGTGHTVSGLSTRRFGHLGRSHVTPSDEMN